jgi:hypothetical protein
MYLRSASGVGPSRVRSQISPRALITNEPSHRCRFLDGRHSTSWSSSTETLTFFMRPPDTQKSTVGHARCSAGGPAAGPGKRVFAYVERVGGPNVPWGGGYGWHLRGVPPKRAAGAALFNLLSRHRHSLPSDPTARASIVDGQPLSTLGRQGQGIESCIRAIIEILLVIMPKIGAFSHTRVRACIRNKLIFPKENWVYREVPTD